MALVLFSGTMLAVPEKVAVTLPAFTVELNGVKIDNTYNQYPLIVYKGITYFPMTFYDSRLMGLETEWSVEKGLEIEQTGVVGEYRENKKKSKNAYRNWARIPTFPITVNEEIIDNSQEEYPLLVFRDVTYFPLTWHFAVDEFKGQYHFESNGLTIQAGNHVLQEVVLPDEKKGLNAIEVFDGYYYYVGEKHEEDNVYRAPVDDPSKVSKVYIISGSWSYSPLVSFFKQDNDVYFSYHVGGATMGRDIYCRVNKEGFGEEVLSGYLDFRKYGQDLVVVNYGVPPFPNNLYLLKVGSEERKSLGNPAYCYGWIRYKGNYFGGREMEIKDDRVYITGFEKENENEPNKLYAIKINTNEIFLVSTIPTTDFTLWRDKIYMLGSEDGLLYETTGASFSTSKDAQEKVLINTPLSSYVVNSKGTIYYLTQENKELFSLDVNGVTRAMLPQKKMSTIKIVDDKLICFLEENEVYGLVVFDEQGKEIFKISERVISASLAGDVLVYKTVESQKNYAVRLP
ncbi:MAG: DUF5050 domain-containing protein, partial [Clostridia bacterium]|nr:DUF5050 domain-containing protein [Clostridia bacterium]